MCGIAGSINFSLDTIQPLKDALFHRGPNQQDIFSYKNINLIHTRLSIQDIANGAQPFTCKEYTIIFNGEIYNHKSLREEYLKEFSFQTSSDTETLLYMYIKYQNDMFEKLDGMFAFCIFDKKRDILFLARDRAGKKPLYLYKKDDRLLFASELNAIKSVLAPKVNEDSIYSYLKEGFFYKDSTPYEDIEELEAGCFYEIDCTALDIKKSRYFDILDFYKTKRIADFEYAKDKLDTILHKSVQDRLLSSDLEVGAFLSGGIDSGLIVAIASEYKRDLKTFTVRFDGAYDESSLAKLTAKKYGTKHYELQISMNLKDDMEKILLNYGEPFMDSSAIPSYYVSKEAKKYVTVTLNGDGADELFGGYRRYVPVANGWIKIASYLSLLDRVLPKPHNKKSIHNYLFRLLKMSQKNGLDFYNSATNDIFEDVYSFRDNSILKEIREFINGIESMDMTPLSKMLYLDFNLILQSDLLKKMDIATMTNSLEGRSPFLSRYMLEFAPSLDDSLKIRGVTTKYLLRELAKKYLPKELINQPKRGFEVPLRRWVESDLKDMVFDSLQGGCYSQNFIKREFIDRLLENRVDVSAQKRAKMLWSMFCLEVWRKSA